jgi:hypothetical protein
MIDGMTFALIWTPLVGVRHEEWWIKVVNRIILGSFKRTDIFA